MGSQKHVEPFNERISEMKKFLMMLVAATTLMLSANAQNADNQQGEHKQLDKTEIIQKQTDRMVERYGLSEEQAKQLLKLNTAYGGRFMGRPGGHGPRRNGQGQPPVRRDSVERQRPTQEQMEAMKKEMTAKMEAYRSEVKKIMTEGQYAKYESDLKRLPTGRRSSEK